MVSFWSRTDKMKPTLLSSLSQCGGNMFLNDFKKHIASSDNFEVKASSYPFFLNTDLSKDTSFFMTPRSLKSATYKDFLTILFIVCSCVPPHYIRKYIYEELPQENSPDHFLIDVAEILEDGSNSPKERIERLIKTANSRLTVGYVPTINVAEHRNQTLVWTQIFHLNSVRSGQYNIFEIGLPMEASTAKCTKCCKEVNLPLDISNMMIEFGTTSLQEMLVPVVGSVWDTRKIGLRCGRKKFPYACPHCDNDKMEWTRVSLELEEDGKYPIILIIKRYIPMVEHIIVDKEQTEKSVPPVLTLNDKRYIYRGWTAKMGHLNFVPYLLTHTNRVLRHSWIPFGIVKDISDQRSANKLPKDPRHVDLLVYFIEKL